MLNVFGKVGDKTSSYNNLVRNMKKKNYSTFKINILKLKKLKRQCKSPNKNKSLCS